MAPPGPPETQPDRLTTVDVARVPHPGRNGLSRRTTKFTSDGKLVYLHSPEGSVERQVAMLDLSAVCAGAAAEPVVMQLPSSSSRQSETLEEQMRRERMRDLGEGVSNLCTARFGRPVVVQQGTCLLVAESAGAPFALARDCGALGSPVDVRLSNDGRFLACVIGAEIFTMRLGHSSSFSQLTFPARGSPPDSRRGTADFVAQEEFERLEGYWWSPDSRMIAFQEVAESSVPPFRIQHLGSDNFHEEEHRYPFAGKDNPTWRIGIVAINEGDGGSGGVAEPMWLQPPALWFADGAPGSSAHSHPHAHQSEYLANLTWLPDSSGVALSLLSRSQQELATHLFDSTGQYCGLLHRESSSTWINLTRMFWPLEGLSIGSFQRGGSSEGHGNHSEGFVLSSERNGFCHLYYHRANGEVAHPITAGDFVVLSLEGIATDGPNPLVYFTATLEDDPTQQHVLAAPLLGNQAGGPGTVSRVTESPGVHGCLVNVSRGYFLDIYSSLQSPETVALYQLSNSKLIARLSWQLSDFELHRTRMLRPPEILHIHNRHGTLLYAAVFRPDSEQYGPGPYPTVISLYGGPHVQLVQNSWGLTASMREQLYRQSGWLVVKIDNRGSANRGVAFESAIHHRLGEAEIEDQVDGLEWLVKQGLTDASRVVCMGWSYGGYLAARMLMHPSSRGKVAAAVAGAPVTHWDGYDTGYTERYMGTPQTNPDGYLSSSVFHHIDHMQGSLLLVHGLLDENVHFRHTARLINRLITSQKRYQLLVFPDERHMPRHEKDRIYMEETVMEFLAGSLSAKAPPSNHSAG